MTILGIPNAAASSIFVGIAPDFMFARLSLYIAYITPISSIKPGNSSSVNGPLVYVRIRRRTLSTSTPSPARITLKPALLAAPIKDKIGSSSQFSQDILQLYCSLLVLIQGSFDSSHMLNCDQFQLPTSRNLVRKQ